MGPLVFLAMLTMTMPTPAPDPLSAPLTPHTIIMVKELPCPDGSTLDVQLHDVMEKPTRRIAFYRDDVLIAVLDLESERVYIAALNRVYPLADDTVPTSACDLPVPVKTS